MLPAAIEDYYRPKSLKEAADLASQYNEGEAIFLAGGQSAMQAIKTRILRPRCVIDLQNLDELRQVDIGKRSAGLGALVRYVDLAEKQDIPPALLALKDACTHVGDRQVRNRGTIGGSLCWNYVAACVPAVCKNSLCPRCSQRIIFPQRRDPASRSVGLAYAPTERCHFSL